jgi:hypothetical protein
MDSNEQTVQKHVVVNTPGQRSEVLTERTQRGPRESGLSTGTNRHNCDFSDHGHCCDLLYS